MNLLSRDNCVSCLTDFDNYIIPLPSSLTQSLHNAMEEQRNTPAKSKEAPQKKNAVLILNIRINIHQILIFVRLFIDLCI